MWLVVVRLDSCGRGDGTNILPLPRLQVEYFYVEAPTTHFCRWTTEQFVAQQNGLVFDRTQEILRQCYTFWPCLAAIAWFLIIAFPCLNSLGDFIKYPQLAIRHLKEHRIPARCKLTVDISIIHQDRLLPLVGTLGLDAYPDTHIIATFISSPKVGTQQISLLCFNNGRSMTRWEWSLLIQKLVADNCSRILTKSGQHGATQ